MNSRVPMVFALGAFALVAGLAGYFVGTSTQTSTDEAAAIQRASYATNFESAKSFTYARSKAANAKRGARTAAKAGARIGASRGLRAGAKEKAHNEAAAKAKAAEAAESRPCVQIDDSSSECQYLGPGSGYGPCPPGSEPNASGGVVCVKVRD